jgi:hypothetical protein
VTITPSAHEKAEWSRMAQAAYLAGHNATGHRYSVAASIPINAPVPVTTFDSLQTDYRAWLIEGVFPVAAAA